MNDTDKLTEKRIAFFKKADEYMNDNNMKISGDIMEVLVNVLGNTAQSLICIPYI